jgi:EAL domain-containing protein (putative c-di-GMP-specific phosphodiesterase class I)
MQDWTALAERGVLLKLSLNVPAALLLDDDFVDQVHRVLPADPRFPGLVIEITEDEVILDPDWVREAALQLRLFNASIAIDDFGSSHASLSGLGRLPFTELKLDRPFVSGCGSNRLKRAAVRTAIDLAHSFGATLCAEGVETSEDMQCLLQLGCDTAQGYFFARPMPVDTLARTLLAS